MSDVAQRKSYGQFCALARALDRIGDRWTLLIVRELLLGPRSFRQLQDALPGLSPSLLTERITALRGDGIIARNDAPRRSKAVTYSLTTAGRGLEPAVLELIRWGSRWMVSGPGSDRVDPAWAPLALRALLDGQPAPAGCVHLDVGGIPVTVQTRDGRKLVTAGHHGTADATVGAALDTMLAIAAGAATLDESDAVVTGSPTVAAAILGPGASMGGGPGD